MSARQLRRSFATPFVVTLGATVAVSACTKQPAPLPHKNPPAPHENPPAPEARPEEPAPAPPIDPAPAPAAPDQPLAADPNAETRPVKPDIIHRNPPPPDAADSKQPKPAPYDRRWTVTKQKNQAECQAFLDSACPKVEPGKPVPPCNPPPPVKYTCPDGFQDGQQLKIVMRANATQCFVDRPRPRCPQGMRCNPPPPRKIACPSQ